MILYFFGDFRFPLFLSLSLLNNPVYSLYPSIYPLVPTLHHGPTPTAFGIGFGSARLVPIPINVH
jgi:hypothetical protein